MKKKLSGKLVSKNWRHPSAVDAELPTAFACRRLKDIEDLNVIARDLMKTTCEERVVRCRGNKLMLTAVCPSREAARHFENEAQTYVDVLYMQKHIQSRKK